MWTNLTVRHYGPVTSLRPPRRHALKTGVGDAGGESQKSTVASGAETPLESHRRRSDALVTEELPAAGMDEASDPGGVARRADPRQRISCALLQKHSPTACTPAAGPVIGGPPNAPDGRAHGHARRLLT